MLKDENSTITEIDECLPQTHCRKCGFISCLPYAKAVVKKKTTIYKCEPGGTRVVANLARITGEEVVQNQIKDKPPEIVYINPDSCIGCALCLPKCPIDAISGAEGFLHTIIVDECSGCLLCVDSCPVDCITEKKREKDNPWTALKSQISKSRFYEKRERTKKILPKKKEDRLENVRRILFKEKQNHIKGLAKK